MKRIAILLTLALTTAPAFAAKLSCQKLKEQIAAKIEAHGVKKFYLEVVPKDASAPGKVVGTCDGGAKKIVYRRG